MPIKGKNARLPSCSEAITAAAKDTADRWKKNVHEAKWEYWEHQFQTITKNNAWQRLKYMKGAIENKEIGNIQGGKSFQGKCNLLRSFLFPANGTTANHPQNYFPLPEENIVDDFPPVTVLELVGAFRNISMKSAQGADHILQPMVVAIHNTI